MPPEKRFKHKNLLMGAVYVGKVKPHPNVFLKHVCPNVADLREGFDVRPGGVSEVLRVKAVFLCGTCDYPAKGLMFNQKYYNGHYSCPKCLSKVVLGPHFRIPREFQKSKNGKIRNFLVFQL